MDDATRAILARALESNEKIATLLAKSNDEPSPVRQDQLVGVASQTAQPTPTARRGLSATERAVISKELRSLSDAELFTQMSFQMQKRDSGIPLNTWLNAGGRATQDGFFGLDGRGGLQSQVEPDIMKAVDSTAISALIRQDLEPFLYEVFVRAFPAYERIPKEPANGLVHAWNQITAYGDAAFMAELGTVTDDQSTYVRKTTNVAILATRRGVSLKSQFAVAAGGMNYNPEAIELAGGVRALAHAMQRQIFSGNASATGGTYSNEYGNYDANAFDGLRYLLGVTQGNSINVDPATNPTTTGNVRRAVDQALRTIIQNGGNGPFEIWSHPFEKQTFDEQQDSNVRILEASQRNAEIGVVAQAVNTIAGQIGWNIVPGDSIDPTAGSTGYNVSSYIYPGAATVRDIYILSPSALSIPYLGTEGPTVLDIPVGISGQLTRLFVVFLMGGLAPKVLVFHNKIRAKLS